MTHLKSSSLHRVGRSRGPTQYLPQSDGIDDVLPDWEDHDQDIDDIACKLPHDIVDVLSAWEDDDEDQDFDDIVYTLTPVDCMQASTRHS